MSNIISDHKDLSVLMSRMQEQFLLTEDHFVKNKQETYEINMKINDLEKVT